MNIFLIGDSIRVDYGSYLESYIGKDINIIGKEGIEEAYQHLDIPVGSNCGDSRMLVERERYPEGFPFVRYEDDVVEYNRIANNVMHSYNVEVIDMYSFTKSLGLCGDALYRDHAHFHKQIIQLQAAYLAGALSALVKRESV